MTADNSLRHCYLLMRRDAAEGRLALCRTVGDVWAVTEALDAIDAALEATDRTETT
jgi:hypothetical protein